MTLLIICFFTFLIHISETVAYCMRLAGIRTKQIAIAMSLWRPFLVSVAADRTVRVYNTQAKKMEMMVKYEEEPVNVAIHPNGLYLAVAFLDNIKFISILLNELDMTKESKSPLTLIAHECINLTKKLTIDIIPIAFPDVFV